MWKVRQLASFAKPTPIPRTKTEPQSAVHVRAIVLPNKEVRNAPIVNLVNIKIKSTAKKCALNVLLDTNRKLKTHNVAIHVDCGRKVNSVQMDPACVFIAMLVNFNSKSRLLAPAKNVRKANTKRTKE